jgi:hypothetical protein
MLVSVETLSAADNFIVRATTFQAFGIWGSSLRIMPPASIRAKISLWFWLMGVLFHAKIAKFKSAKAQTSQILQSHP